MAEPAPVDPDDFTFVEVCCVTDGCENENAVIIVQILPDSLIVCGVCRSILEHTPANTADADAKRAETTFK